MNIRNNPYFFTRRIKWDPRQKLKKTKSNIINEYVAAIEKLTCSASVWDGVVGAPLVWDPPNMAIGKPVPCEMEKRQMSSLEMGPMPARIIARRGFIMVLRVRIAK
ncbi:hypothetical protein PIB30_018764 [Stylosanthes scabra]|uniref:Uncharacterized protein n=1 Tax=Stylosanthes scabra TaxID=79078 RepID=A0ABU6Q8Q9_9FABA|nr:hypothetical protein [Stylosanthes scabra]